MGDFALLREPPFPSWGTSCQGPHDYDVTCSFLAQPGHHFAPHCQVILGGGDCAPRSPKLPLIGDDYPLLPCSHPGTEGTVLIQILSLPLLAVVFQQVTSPL